MKAFLLLDNRMNTCNKGLQGEQQAEKYLCTLGMTCVGRRYHSPYGEIDLIMLDQDNVLAFVEVKARWRGTLQSAHAAVTPSKQRKIIQTALC